jgi:hypothetical protein
MPLILSDCPFTESSGAITANMKLVPTLAVLGVISDDAGGRFAAINSPAFFALWKLCLCRQRRFEILSKNYKL